MTFELSAAISALNNLDVHIPPATSATGHIPCNSSTPPNEIWKCGTSNIGAGLALAHDAFSYAQPYRPEARWGAMLSLMSLPIAPRMIRDSRSPIHSMAHALPLKLLQHSNAAMRMPTHDISSRPILR